MTALAIALRQREEALAEKNPSASYLRQLETVILSTPPANLPDAAAKLSLVADMLSLSDLVTTGRVACLGQVAEFLDRIAPLDCNGGTG